MTTLRIRDLVVEYTSDGHQVRPIDGLDLDAADGELVVLLGPSGSGKTTLLSCLGGILRPTSGSILLGGAELTAFGDRALEEHRRNGVGIVFQAFNLIPALSALDNVAIPLFTTGTPTADARRRAAQLLELVGLTGREDHRPAHLSGGQQQRVAIARSLVHDPPVLLADEPTANLDHVQAAGVIELLRDLRGPGRLVFVSTHDQRLVPVADRVLDLVPRIDGGRDAIDVATWADGEVVFEEGSWGDRVYVVDTGAVEILQDDGMGDPVLLAVLEPGRYFGELGPTLGFPRSATARAKGLTTLTSMDVRTFRERIGSNGEGTAST